MEDQIRCCLQSVPAAKNDSADQDETCSGCDVEQQLISELRSKFPKTWAMLSSADGQTLLPNVLTSYMRKRSLLEPAAISASRCTGNDQCNSAIEIAPPPSSDTCLELRFMLRMLLTYLHGDKGGLEVRTSLISSAGMGLFATRKFLVGELICVYSGTARSLGQLVKGELSTDYTMGGFGLYSIDASDHPNVLARYINDNFDSDMLNSKFVKLKSERRALVIATRDISCGAEIYVPYGEVYWRQRLPPSELTQAPLICGEQCALVND